MAHAPIGFRIRNARKALGITQAALAAKAEISASYLNLIEANKRTIGGALLVRIARLLDIDPDALTGRAERRLIADLEEIAAEPAARDIAIPTDAAAELVGQHPEWARVILGLHRALRDQTGVATALTDRLNQDPFLGDAIHQVLTNVTAIRSASEILEDSPDMPPAQEARFRAMIGTESARLTDTAQSLARFFDQAQAQTRPVTPADEVDDFLVDHGNWFPELEHAADKLRATIEQYSGAYFDDLSESAFSDYLRKQHHITVTPPVAPGLDSGFRNQMRYQQQARQVTFLTNASASTRRFQLARLIAAIAAADVIADTSHDPLLASAEARARSKHVLASYVASALILPYAAFHQTAVDCRYDIELLRQRFGASYEQICHRLVTLRDPRREGVPFAFLRSDQAGHLTKRFPLANLPLPRHGHACPLWAVFMAFQTPNRVTRQLVEFPDGNRFLMIARTVTKQPALFHETPFLHSVMLVCDVLRADQTVYADGLDLSSDQAAIPVGTSCRLCPREACRFRGEEAIVTGSVTGSVGGSVAGSPLG